MDKYDYLIDLLTEKLPFVRLGNLPTPVDRLDRVGKKLSIKTLYIKRDDISGKFYGGNKVRKLEFLLGYALGQKVKRIITIGAAGSNHALATSVYAKKLGIPVTVLLVPQPGAEYVRKNLLLDYLNDAEIISVPSYEEVEATLFSQVKSYTQKDGCKPFVIPPGGTTVLGVAGFVRAALELAGQIDREELRPPDYIYVPLGSMGTAAGLIIGCRVAGLRTKIRAVSVVDNAFANAVKLQEIMDQAIAFINKRVPGFPKVEISADDYEVIDDMLGKGYAWFSSESINAVKEVEKEERIILEGTYSGKAFAALMRDKESLADRTVLFWNTYSSVDLNAGMEEVDFNVLPEEFHYYFTGPVQKYVTQEL